MEENRENKKVIGMREKYFIKTRDLVLKKDQADAYGIRRIYNRCSDIDYMPDDNKEWADSLYSKERGECVLVETAVKFIDNVPLHVATCIVFYTVEQGNLYFMRHGGGYEVGEGFAHLFN